MFIKAFKALAESFHPGDRPVRLLLDAAVTLARIIIDLTRRGSIQEGGIMIKARPEMTAHRTAEELRTGASIKASRELADIVDSLLEAGHI